MKGIVFDIQKFCLHDGPGIRTTVFLKGCDMRCQWCHNPESFEPKVQLGFLEKNCTLCRACEAVCPMKVHSFHDEKHHIKRDDCISCGRCVDACPADALKLIGKEIDTEEVIREVLKDKKYYQTSKGGVTFSGGEATMQFDFLKELLTKAKDNELHTALETNGLINAERLKVLCQLVDLFLFDYKLTNNEEHKRWTGVGNDVISSNLELLSKDGKEVILRCPIIPGVNDTEEHFEGIKAVKERYSNISKAEIMAYHDIGRNKWKEVGLDYKLQELKSATSDEKKKWESLII